VEMFKKSTELKRRTSTWGEAARQIGVFLQPR
jgi:hypothetical protein